METVRDFIFCGSKITADSDCSREIKSHLLLGRKATKNIESILKSRDITLPTKVSIVKAMVFPIVMYGCELDYKEGWLPKNWCFQTVVLEKTLESPLDTEEIKRVHPKGSQSWIFIGRTDAEVEASIFWPPDAYRQLTGRDPDAGKDWGQEEKGATEDEMVGWHYQLNEHEFEHKFWEIVKGREAWRAADHRVAKSWTWLSDYTATCNALRLCSVCYFGHPAQLVGS